MLVRMRGEADNKREHWGADWRASVTRDGGERKRGERIWTTKFWCWYGTGTCQDELPSPEPVDSSIREFGVIGNRNGRRGDSGRNLRGSRRTLTDSHGTGPLKIALEVSRESEQIHPDFGFTPSQILAMSELFRARSDLCLPNRPLASIFGGPHGTRIWGAYWGMV